MNDLDRQFQEGRIESCVREIERLADRNSVSDETLAQALLAIAFAIQGLWREEKEEEKE